MNVFRIASGGTSLAEKPSGARDTGLIVLYVNRSFQRLHVANLRSRCPHLTRC
jgi:hypothetical protein